MIRVRVEMCPLGNEAPDRVRELARMYIANDGKASRENPNRGDYRVAVCRAGSVEVPAEISGAVGYAPKATRSGSVMNYPRKSYHVMRLISRALRACFPEDRSDPLVDLLAFQECRDEQARELGREIIGATSDSALDYTEIGRAAWLRGARPRGY